MTIEELETATAEAWDAFSAVEKEANRLRSVWCELHLQVKKYELEQRLLKEIEAENAK